MPFFLPLICLLGMGMALLGSPRDASAGQAPRDDLPARLLGWAAGLLPAQRAEWGQAMVGELDNIDGRGRRWRFAAGCAGAALLLPPWGRAAAAVWAMAAVAVGGAGLYASVIVRYQLGTSDWVLAGIALIVLVSYTLVVGVQVRVPGVALPGLLAGVLVALTWLMPYGFTFYGLIVVVPHLWAPGAQLIVEPLLLGMIGALWGGSAVAGRRIARLAALSAGLYVFLYGTLAVAVIGAAGAQIDATWTVRANVADRLSTNAVIYLWFLPVTTAALGWAAAAATARARPRLAARMAPVPLATAGHQAGQEAADLVTAPREAGPAARARGWHRVMRVLTVCVIVAAIVALLAVSLLKA
jgi:hypothetical protein